MEIIIGFILVVQENQPSSIFHKFAISKKAQKTMIRTIENQFTEFALKDETISNDALAKLLQVMFDPFEEDETMYVLFKGKKFHVAERASERVLRVRNTSTVQMNAAANIGRMILPGVATAFNPIGSHRSRQK